MLNLVIMTVRKRVVETMAMVERGGCGCSNGDRGGGVISHVIETKK